MTEPREGSLVIVPAGEGCAVDRINGERATITIGRAATRGTYALRENTAPPGFSNVP
jgi:hypothetical protein